MPAWIKKSLHGFELRSLSQRPRFARGAPELFVVIAGSGRARLDDDLVELQPWDVLRVEEGVRRSFEAGPDGLRILSLDGREPRVVETERFAN